MAPRVRLESNARQRGGGLYFAGPSSVDTFETGCKVLDLALGGGWAERRIANIVGDKSTGKTLLAIEASVNFLRKHPKGKVRYRETEAAFDEDYAEALGMPVDRIDFGDPLETVEDMFEDLSRVISRAKVPELYIVDSLDALTDKAEMERGITEGSYGAGKAKQMSQLFRRLTRRIEESNVTVIIISQIRDKMNAGPYGRKTTRSGGRALDFYASQVLHLAQIKTLSKTVKGIKRPTGIMVRGKVDKNKVGLPFREAQFPIVFGYGIDDGIACIDWCKENKCLPDLLKGAKEPAFRQAWTTSQDAKQLVRMRQAVQRNWYSIEKSFIPTRRKYA